MTELYEDGARWTDEARESFRTAAANLVEAIRRQSAALLEMDGVPDAEAVDELLAEADELLETAASAYADAQYELTGTVPPLGLDEDESPDDDLLDDDLDDDLDPDLDDDPDQDSDDPLADDLDEDSDQDSDGDPNEDLEGFDEGEDPDGDLNDDLNDDLDHASNEDLDEDLDDEVDDLDQNSDEHPHDGSDERRDHLVHAVPGTGAPDLKLTVLHRADFVVIDELAVIQAGKEAYHEAFDPSDEYADHVDVSDIGEAIQQLRQAGGIEALAETPGLASAGATTWILEATDLLDERDPDEWPTSPFTPGEDATARLLHRVDETAG